MVSSLVAESASYNLASRGRSAINKHNDGQANQAAAAFGDKLFFGFGANALFNHQFVLIQELASHVHAGIKVATGAPITLAGDSRPVVTADRRRRSARGGCGRFG